MRAALSRPLLVLLSGSAGGPAVGRACQPAARGAGLRGHPARPAGSARRGRSHDPDRPRRHLDPGTASHRHQPGPVAPRRIRACYVGLLPPYFLLRPSKSSTLGRYSAGRMASHAPPDTMGVRAKTGRLTLFFESGAVHVIRMFCRGLRLHLVAALGVALAIPALAATAAARNKPRKLRSLWIPAI